MVPATLRSLASPAMPVVVHPDPDALARDAAVRIVAALSAVGDPRANLGLAGGSTPRRTYEELTRITFDWPRVDLWLSDERWVPHDDARSNGAMVERVLTSRITAPLHRPAFDDGADPHRVAADYERLLHGIIPDGRPDVVLLGMGADGHTASLFPRTAALDERTRWYVANRLPDSGEWRLTSTFPLLLSAHHLFVLVTGEAKAATLRAVLEGEPGRYPAQRLADAGDRVTWLVDGAAASQLSTVRMERAT